MFLTLATSAFWLTLSLSFISPVYAKEGLRPLFPSLILLDEVHSGGHCDLSPEERKSETRGEGCRSCPRFAPVAHQILTSKGV